MTQNHVLLSYRLRCFERSPNLPIRPIVGVLNSYSNDTTKNYRDVVHNLYSFFIMRI